MVVDDVLIRKFHAPVYGSMVWIVVCKNIHKAIDTVEDLIHFRIATEEDKPFLDAYTYGNLDSTNFCHIIIFVRYDAAPGRIVHESLHAMNILFSYHNVRRNRKDDDHECYYLEDIVNRVHSAISLYAKKVFKK